MIRGVIGFTLAVQPVIVALSTPLAHASDPNYTVVINEIAPADSGDQWVELYNKSIDMVDMTGWQLRLGNNIVSAPIASDTQIVGHGWYVIPLSDNIPLTSSGSSLMLLAGPDPSDAAVDEVGSWNVNAGQSYSRMHDGGRYWMATTPTRGVSNNGVIERQLAIERFATIDGDYKGVEVGFTGSYFGTVSAVEVDVLRADGSHVVKRANQAVLDAMSNSIDVHITAPFVIQEGSYTEAGDVDSWQPADPTSWTHDTIPTNVTVTITDEDGAKQASSSSFEQPTPYDDLLPIVSPPADTEPPSVVVTGETNGVVGEDITLAVTSDEPLSELHVYVGSDELRMNVTKLSDTAWSITYTPAAAGVYMFRVNGIDLAGNLSEDTYFNVAVKVVIVAVPPTIEQTTEAKRQLQDVVAALSQPLNAVDDVRPIVAPHDSSVKFPKSGVLQAADIATADSKAAIVSTGSGWKIFGILWYWWGVIIAGLAAVGWRFNRRLRRAVE